MDCCTPQPPRRHNPVDSICRKLQTIQWRGDREPNSPFQIPKLSSSSYDSPQCGLGLTLGAILKRGPQERKERGDRKPDCAPSQKSNMGPSVLPSASGNTPTPANITYTISSNLGERRGVDRSDLKQFKTWQSYSSTPTSQPKDSPYFTFTRGGPEPTHPESRSGPSGSPVRSRAFTPIGSTVSYNLNFNFSAGTGGSAEGEPPCPALVVKRLSPGDGGNTPDCESNNMAEVSLICEENLLDTIFHACDTQRRGKVYVSHIVDYLRHTTSRAPEDSGLEELCNMLDPERKDVSIDLDTYHAVMKEWIEDCRSNGEESQGCVCQDSVKLRDCLSVRRSMLLNMTSGSLEGFGGDVSKAEFETSELVNCLADLQMSNQKLQEEVKKLKQAMEGMEEGNQKLADENEELRSQTRAHLQLLHKEKMLHDEVEEMKATLSCTEEGRARASARSKHVEKENQNLKAKIASLEDENFKVNLEMDELQKRIAELCDINADLQVQIHSFDTVLTEKESLIQERSRQIDELKTTVEEYSSITELLRADKSKLENHMQMFHPDLSGAGVSLSVAYRLNQSTSGSLQSELALAQSPPEPVHRVEPLAINVCSTSPLDETLDREVLLMMHGPSPELMAQEFKKLLNRMKSDFRNETTTVLSTMKTLLDDHSKPELDADTSLEAVQAALDATREDWALSLDQLAQYTDSIEKELVKMASNMRRSRTEILHLSVRVQDQENQKRQLCEELEQLKTPQDSREASCQTPAPEEETGDDLEWDEECALQDFLKSETAGSNCPGQDGLTESPQTQDGDERWTVVNGTGEGEVRDTSTPVSAKPEDSQDGPWTGQESLEPQVNLRCLQNEAVVPSDAHSQAASPERPAADASLDPSHSDSRETHETTESESLSDRDPTTMSTPTNNAPADEVAPPNESISLTGEDRQADDKEGDASGTASLILDQSGSRSAAQDATSLLPVLVEEEESATTEADMAGTEQPGGVVATTLSDCQQSSVTLAQNGQSESRAASDPNQLQNKKDSNGINKKELESQGTETTEAPKVEEAQPETCATTEKKPEPSTISDHNDREDKNSSLSANDKEIETEFQRLALGFKCDMFTLEKRLRLEERSRDLAEENVRREVSSCQGLLQALTPLCEDDNQSMEIIHRLQKNLDILIQSMTRVSSRSEMLGAIHQESRIGKAVEVMIQHVENLRRVYTKEHAELLELRETLMQNERSFGSHSDRDEFRGKKPSTSQYYKSSARRVSIAAIPRSGGGNIHYDMTKQHNGAESEAERLNRRSPWNVAGKNTARPPLKRFVSSAAWVDTEESSVVMKGTPRHNSDPQPADEPEEPVPERRRSSLSELGSKLTSLILPLKTPSFSSSPASSDQGLSQSLSHSLTSTRSTAAAVARGGRALWLWLAMVLLLAGLLALLASLVMQPAVDAAPVGTGDSWMTIQQLLWPYTGLRHNGQPPV
ncbi:inositol 1,4,5-triphosphate receptor associated 2 isoform X2 [Syngnathoides biaculeatus]|uniref:inositol 1,4,5-triphosphate receptor associated 2 isoform X2 n=1 Tax=Syngnathoides biaculeatus TaxID=300417 RepID=UPI002ADDB8EE|nr:inositol 1,4,5-triphosphate receptor associated 2 isoform X2 [Syngnathoides biaculeatus]